MSSFFGNWFGKSKKQVSQPQPGQKPPAAPKQAPGADLQTGVLYKKGDSFHEISEFFENSEIWLGLNSGSRPGSVRAANRACPPTFAGAGGHVTRSEILSVRGSNHERTIHRLKSGLAARRWRSGGCSISKYRTRSPADRHLQPGESTAGRRAGRSGPTLAEDSASRI